MGDPKDYEPAEVTSDTDAEDGAATGPDEVPDVREDPVEDTDPDSEEKP